MMLKTFAVVMSVALSPSLWAQTDSSADADGFAAQVEESAGVILRVPINERGEENTAAAEMRLHNDNAEVGSLEDAETAWAEATDISDQPTLDSEELQDSSTFGWYSWYYYGWSNPYYYSSYRPYYNNYGYYYRYNYPYYYSSPYYRYYYYPRYW